MIQVVNLFRPYFISFGLKFKQLKHFGWQSFSLKLGILFLTWLFTLKCKYQTIKHEKSLVKSWFCPKRKKGNSSSGGYSDCCGLCNQAEISIQTMHNTISFQMAAKSSPMLGQCSG